MASETIIGIDLGTTNSCIAVRKGNQTIVIDNQEGMRTTPSVFAIKSDGEELVGKAAKAQSAVNPEGTISAVKRFIAGMYKNPKIQDIKKHISYNITEGKNGRVAIALAGKQYAPEEISAKILMKLKQAAKNYLGQEVKKAVITVPAYFDNEQREATKAAGEIAGLEVVRIINEPTAAALAYGLDKKTTDTKIAVFDLGGGTFDISIIELTNIEGNQNFDVLSTNGDDFLGGEDFDHRINEHVVAEFKKEQGIDLSKDERATQRLKEACEKAKIELSSAIQTEINLPYITVDSSGPKHLNIKLTRAQLEGLVEDLIKKTLQPCKIALKNANLSVSDINEVILVGGQTRMPKVQETVEKFFGKKANQSVNPDEVVAIGAAIQGGVLAGDIKDVLLLDVIPLPLGIETMGGVMTKLIDENTTVPTKAEQIFSTAEDNQTAVTIHVGQGKRPQMKDNKSLARFDLTGIAPAPRGLPQIEVTFEVDANSILHVSAKDKATGKAQSMRVERSGLSEEDIERMKKEAELHAEEDRKFAELSQTRNMADGIIHTTTKAMNDAGDKLSSDEKSQLEKALEALKAANKGDDKQAMEDSLKALTDLSSKMSDRLYAKPESAGSESTTTQDNNSDDNKAQSSEDVSDAEFEEVKDKS